MAFPFALSAPTEEVWRALAFTHDGPSYIHQSCVQIQVSLKEVSMISGQSFLLQKQSLRD